MFSFGKKSNPGNSNMIMWVAIGAGALAAWWYVTKYGPEGAAYDAAGNKIGLTFWDSWFGGGTVNTVTGTGAGAGAGTQSPTQQIAPPAITQGAPTQPVVNQPNQPITQANGPTGAGVNQGNYPVTATGGFGSHPVGQTPVAMDQATALLQASGLGQGDTLTASQWNWYYQQVFGDPGAQLGDDGSPMSVDTYLALRFPNRTMSPGNPARIVVGDDPILLTPTPQGGASELMGIGGIVPISATRAGMGMGMSFGGGWNPKTKWRN